jgi:hypothetical protein
MVESRSGFRPEVPTGFPWGVAFSDFLRAVLENFVSLLGTVRAEYVYTCSMGNPFFSFHCAFSDLSLYCPGVPDRWHRDGFSLFQPNLMQHYGTRSDQRSNSFSNSF